jgi:pimeloyl-ACP methyl ester carboxylesterase
VGEEERLGARPAGITAYARMNIQIDISDIVSTIRVPTLVIHRTDDRVVNVAGRFLAEHIPGARYIELPGVDHLRFIGDNAGDIDVGRLDFAAMEAREATPDRGVMIVEEVAPAMIAQRGGSRSSRRCR